MEQFKKDYSILYLEYDPSICFVFSDDFQKMKEKISFTSCNNSECSGLSDDVYKMILFYGKQNKDLEGLSGDYSYEGGFNLPYSTLLRHNFETFGYRLSPQFSRQMRFRSYDGIYRLYPKDFSSWSRKEVDALSDCFKKVGIEIKTVYKKIE